MCEVRANALHSRGKGDTFRVQSNKQWFHEEILIVELSKYIIAYWMPAGGGEEDTVQF